MNQKEICQILFWKSKVLGLSLVFIGLLWYLKNTGCLSPDAFWPLILIVSGLVCFLRPGFHKIKE